MGVPLTMLASDWFSCYCCHCFVFNRYGGTVCVTDQKIRIKSSGRPVPIFKFDNAGMKDPILYILLINDCVVFKKRSKGGPKEGRGGFRAR